MNDMVRVSTDDGKYTVIQDESGAVRALRHGEEWRDLRGDKLALALAQDLDAERGRLEATWSSLVTANRTILEERERRYELMGQMGRMSRRFFGSFLVVAIVMYVIGAAMMWLISEARAGERYWIERDGRTVGHVERYMWTDTFVVRDRDGDTRAVITREHGDYRARDPQGRSLGTVSPSEPRKDWGSFDERWR